MRITITVDGTALPATLNDSAAARDFAAQLPLTLELRDFHHNEKIADLPQRLSTTDAPAGHEAKVGDLTYYSPWGNLAIFYQDFPYSNGLVAMGRIDAPIDPLLAAAAGNHGPTVTIAAAGWTTPDSSSRQRGDRPDAHP